MKLTWSFYPKDEPSITLTVVYVPVLDVHQIESGGFLEVDTNTAYVNWETYCRFDAASVEGRKDAFARLQRRNLKGEVSADNVQFLFVKMLSW